MMQDEVKDDITSGLPLDRSVGPGSLSLMQHKVKNDTAAAAARKTTQSKTSDQLFFPSPIDVFLDFR